MFGLVRRLVPVSAAVPVWCFLRGLSDERPVEGRGRRLAWSKHSALVALATGENLTQRYCADQIVGGVMLFNTIDKLYVL